ncbi:hypothetical protein [Streptomyces sp. NPDC096311]
MRGLTLRRRVRAARPAKVVVRPEIHVPVPAPATPVDNGCSFRN